MFFLMLLLTNVRKTDFVKMEVVHFRFNSATNYLIKEVCELPEYTC
jgi:hypothetical protein